MWMERSSGGRFRHVKSVAEIEAAGGDGLLVMDRNHDGVINNGSELFGVGTVLANGKHAKDGYVAMAEQDSNHDGKLDKAKFISSLPAEAQAMADQICTMRLL